jgi:hypothetical protein
MKRSMGLSSVVNVPTRFTQFVTRIVASYRLKRHVFCIARYRMCFSPSIATLTRLLHLISSHHHTTPHPAKGTAGARASSSGQVPAYRKGAMHNRDISSERALRRIGG